ncbi:coiled-coil domain-containing protein 78-like, partial [Saccoglossus kowalevskii]|uniref:Coiled-coil domain-containing protein 78-like n=1 Tax=Saccoglossus kowalevskii TaxID=10224 RepID=A0ABM0MJ87_SACKO
TCVKHVVAMQMYELCKHDVNDLLEIKNTSKYINSVGIEDIIMQLQKIPVKTSAGATAILKQAWSQKSFSGLKNTVTVVVVELTAIYDNVIHSTKSWFTFIDMSLEIQLANSEGNLMDNILRTLQLAPGHKAMNSGEVQFVRLFQDILGGNCCTAAMLHFYPAVGISTTSMLYIAKQLSSIKNYPITNTTVAEILLTRYLTRINKLEQQITQLSTQREHIAAKKADKQQNMKNKDDWLTQKYKLENQLRVLQDKLKEMVNSNYDLSLKSISAEEEKIEVLVLENEVIELQAEKEELSDKYEIINSKLVGVKTGKKDLLEEQKKLQTMYMKAVEDTKTKVDSVFCAQQDKWALEKKLVGTSHQYETEIHQLKLEYEIEQKEFERVASSLRKDLDTARHAVRTAQLRIAELSTKLVQMTNKCQELGSQNSSLQNKMKDLNEEYRTKLMKYICDIANYVENKATSEQHLKTVMTGQVESGIEDLKKAFKLREQQLSTAAKTFKQQTEKVAVRHEELLVAYRYLREQISSKHIVDIDLGLDEYHLSLPLHELESENRREINRLKDEIEKVKAMSSVPLPPAESITTQNQDDSRWSNLRSRLREFTLNTQQELEAERAALLTRCYIAEQQLEECHYYIETHLTRYKTENNHLRKLLNMDDIDDVTSLQIAMKHNRNKPNINQ